MNDIREVNFFEYCKTCAHENVEEWECPCDECLANCFNYDSHKPVNWKSKEE